ncbi:MAG: hypothetical protein JNL01_16810 [Bdellovibrionales bacterium]|nr:hypothetical protein [Bdellovibrionales bacterium]
MSSTKTSLQGDFNGYELNKSPSAAFEISYISNHGVAFDGWAYIVYMRHISGFIHAQGVNIFDYEVERGYTIYHRKNQKIRAKMARADSVAEYEALKAKLDPSLDVFVPPTHDLVAAMLRKLRPCAEIYGREK